MLHRRNVRPEGHGYLWLGIANDGAKFVCLSFFDGDMQKLSATCPQCFYKTGTSPQTVPKDYKISELLRKFSLDFFFFFYHMKVFLFSI